MAKIIRLKGPKFKENNAESEFSGNITTHTLCLKWLALKKRLTDWRTDGGATNNLQLATSRLGNNYPGKHCLLICQVSSLIFRKFYISKCIEICTVNKTVLSLAISRDFFLKRKDIYDILIDMQLINFQL